MIARISPTAISRQKFLLQTRFSRGIGMFIRLAFVTSISVTSLVCGDQADAGCFGKRTCCTATPVCTPCAPVYSTPTVSAPVFYSAPANYSAQVHYSAPVATSCPAPAPCCFDACGNAVPCSSPQQVSVQTTQIFRSEVRVVGAGDKPVTVVAEDGSEVRLFVPFSRSNVTGQAF